MSQDGMEGYVREVVEGYEVESQPDRLIRVRHRSAGQLLVEIGCAGALIEALQRAQDNTMRGVIDG